VIRRDVRRHPSHLPHHIHCHSRHPFVGNSLTTANRTAVEKRCGPRPDAPPSIGTPDRNLRTRTTPGAPEERGFAGAPPSRTAG
jgi:hypothetical protein